MAYKMIDETFWTDPDIRSLSCKSKLLFLYLVTNPHCHYSGVYYLPEMFIQIETGLPVKDIKVGLQELSGEGFIKYDPCRSMVWVVKMARYQIKGGSSNKDMMKGIANHFQSLHKTPLIKDFLQYYGDLDVPLESHLVDSLIGTPEGPVEAPLTPPAESGEGEEEVSGEEKNLCNRESLFQEFWGIYPARNGKKVGKAEAKEFFLSTKIKDEEVSLILQAAGNYAVSKAATDGFAKDAIRFLRKDFWKDWVEPENTKKAGVSNDRYGFLRGNGLPGGGI